MSQLLLLLPVLVLLHTVCCCKELSTGILMLLTAGCAADYK
jgi:hypothetical protein